MTGHGEPYEGEKKKGEMTAKVKSGKGLDPVGQEDKDIDNDGDHDKSDKYLLNRRKVRGAAIGKRKGVSEEFLGELNDETVASSSKEKKIDVMKGRNKVVISPEVPGSGKNMTGRLQVAHHEMDGPFITEKAVSQAQQKFMGMVYAAKKGGKAASPEVAKAAAGMSEKEARKFAKTKHKGLPTHKEEAECGSDKKEKEVDPRQMKTMKDRTRTALGLMGIKASYEPNGKTILEYERGDEPGEPGSSIRRGSGGRYQGDLKTLQQRIDRGDRWKSLQAPLPPVRGAKKPEPKKDSKTA